MRIRLISGDPFLSKLCREVLLGFKGREWDFGMIPSVDHDHCADLLIWDLQPEMQIPQNPDFDPRRKNIFLISRKQVGDLQRRLLPGGCSIVLKPVNPVLLRALVEETLAQFESRERSREIAEQLRLERDEMLQHLLQANLKLQEYDQDRTNFLAHSVHDVRAPLMAVQGYCALLLEGQLGTLNPEQTKVLERMQRSIKRLARLTSGMFQMSVGPQQASRRLPSKAGDIQACVAQAVHEVGPAAEAKQIELRLQITAPPEALRFDEMQIEQVLVNLLDNACRFTPRNGLIEIRAHSVFWDRRCPNLTEDVNSDRRESLNQDHNAYRVEIRDSGPGVPVGDLERIFEEYTTDSATYEWSRAGLGLAICRQIVHAHHGVVFAESLGQGAIFVFILPYAEKMGQPQATTPPSQYLAAGFSG